MAEGDMGAVLDLPYMGLLTCAYQTAVRIHGGSQGVWLLDFFQTPSLPSG